MVLCPVDNPVMADTQVKILKPQKSLIKEKPSSKTGARSLVDPKYSDVIQNRRTSFILSKDVQKEKLTKENSVASVKSKTLANKAASLYLSRTVTNLKKKDQPVVPVDSNKTSQDESTKQTTQLSNQEHTPAQNKPSEQKLLSEQTKDSIFAESENDVTEEKREDEDRRRVQYETVYLESCKRLGIVPVSFISKRLCDPSITMKSHGLGPEGTRAIAVALVNNEKVESLDVTDNWIGEDGASFMAQMLTENSYITELNLSENLIGSKGVKDICDVVQKKECLRVLNLSGTGIKDSDAIRIAEVIQNNLYLKELYLNHNEISDEGGKFIGKTLRRNGTLQTLDLSWNHLRRQGAVALTKGIQENCGLRHLDISWNGFGVEGCKALAKALEKNFTLTHLDLRSNRLHTEAVTFLLGGITKNEGLKYLNLSYNPITPSVARLILSTVCAVPDSPLTEIDMSDIVVDIEFVNLLQTLKEERVISVSHGPCISKHDLTGVNKDDVMRGAADPRDIMFEFMNKDALRSVDFFKRLDKSGKGMMSKKKFKAGIVAMEIPLTSSQLDNLVEMLDKGKTGQITVKELSNEERAYKRRMHALKRKRAKLAAELAAMKKAEKEASDEEL